MTNRSYSRLPTVGSMVPVELESILRQIENVHSTTTENLEQLVASKRILTKLQINDLNNNRQDFSVSSPCLCAHESSFISPRQLQSICGRLMIRTTGRCRYCNPSNLRQSTANEISISYVLPSWCWLQKGILFKYSQSWAQSWTMRLSLRSPWTMGLFLRSLSIIPKDSEVFQLCYQGEVAKLQKLFVEGRASRFDADPELNTLLHVGYMPT